MRPVPQVLLGLSGAFRARTDSIIVTTVRSGTVATTVDDSAAVLLKETLNRFGSSAS
jgi:hypothetical protein